MCALTHRLVLPTQKARWPGALHRIMAGASDHDAAICQTSKSMLKHTDPSATWQQARIVLHGVRQNAVCEETS